MRPRHDFAHLRDPSPSEETEDMADLRMSGGRGRPPGRMMYGGMGPMGGMAGAGMGPMGGAMGNPYLGDDLRRPNTAPAAYGVGAGAGMMPQAMGMRPGFGAAVGAPGIPGMPSGGMGMDGAAYPGHAGVPGAGAAGMGAAPYAYGGYAPGADGGMPLQSGAGVQAGPHVPPRRNIPRGVARVAGGPYAQPVRADSDPMPIRSKAPKKKTSCPHSHDHFPGLDSLDACICSNNCACKKGHRVVYFEDRPDGEPLKGEIRYVLKDDLGKDCGDHSGCYTASGKKREKMNVEEECRAARKTAKEGISVLGEGMREIQERLDRMNMGQSGPPGAGLGTGQEGLGGAVGLAPRGMAPQNPMMARRLDMAADPMMGNAMRQMSAPGMAMNTPLMSRDPRLAQMQAMGPEYPGFGGEIDSELGAMDMMNEIGRPLPGMMGGGRRGMPPDMMMGRRPGRGPPIGMGMGMGGRGGRNHRRGMGGRRRRPGFPEDDMDIRGMRGDRGEEFGDSVMEDEDWEDMGEGTFDI